MKHEISLKIVENMEGIEKEMRAWLIREMKVYICFYHIIQ